MRRLLVFVILALTMPFAFVFLAIGAVAWFLGCISAFGAHYLGEVVLVKVDKLWRGENAAVAKDSK